jgi:hypothetical protein
MQDGQDNEKHRMERTLFYHVYPVHPCELPYYTIETDHRL